MVSRRKFLYQSGVVLSGLAFFPEEMKFGEKSFNEAKEICFDLLNKPVKYSNYLTFKEYLKNKDLEYILNSSKKILKEDFLFESNKTILNFSDEFFYEAFKPYPSFSLPLISRVLYDFNQAENKNDILGTIVKEGNIETLWFGGKKEGDSSRFSIPYYDSNKLLIYGEGKKWGFEGKGISLVRHKRVGREKTKIQTDCFIKVNSTTGLSKLVLPFLKGTISNKAINKLVESYKDIETFSKILSLNVFEAIKNKYSLEEQNFMKKLILKK